jgi:hypothetical protein
MQPMQPMQPMMQQPMQPPQKKGLSGCAIAAIIAGVVVLLGVLAVVAVLFLVVKKAGQVVGDMQAAVKEAQNAPGTSELRSAGCTQAMALDPAKFAKQALKDIPGNYDIDAGSGLFVSCQVPAGTKMTCGEVAKTFVAAPTHQPGPFTASVTDPQGNESCARDYDASGKEIGAATRHANVNTPSN